MMLSSPVASGVTGLIEPPVSPGAPVVAPVEQPSPAAARSLEADIVRMGLMTPDDVEALMREEVATGRAFADLAVERGHITAENMAKLAEPPAAPVGIETEPAPPERRTPIFGDGILAPPTSTPIVVDPEPVVVAHEAVVAAPAPEAVVAAEQTPDCAHVFICLSSGERIAAGTFATEAEAEQHAYELMSAVDVPGSWPKLDGRFIRPDAIVSIDVELTSA